MWNLFGRDQPRNDRFAQPPGRFDEHSLTCGIEWITREQHARDFRVDQPLHDHRHGHLALVDIAVSAIRLGPLRIDRSPAAADGLDERLVPLHAQDGLLQSGKTGRGPVFDRGRRTNGDHTATQTLVSTQQFAAQIVVEPLSAECYRPV